MNAYQRLIREIDPAINPAGVELRCACYTTRVPSAWRSILAGKVGMRRRWNCEQPGCLRKIAEIDGAVA